MTLLPCGHEEAANKDYRGKPWVTDDGRHRMCRVCWWHWNVQPYRPRKAPPPPPPGPAGEWPRWAKALARRRRPGEKGVGDTLKRKLGLAGVLFTAAAKRLGFDCGCADKQAGMNRDYPYSDSMAL